MQEIQMSEKLAFLRSHRRQDEASLLAQALQEGVGLLYRQALVEAYLLGELPRERMLEELGAEELEAIDYQRDALQKDIEWGLTG